MMPDTARDIAQELRSNLSDKADILVPTHAVWEQHTQRWTAYQAPQFAACVVVAEEEDVAKTITYAKAQNTPFMATTARHGDFAAMAEIQNGIQIDLSRFDKVEVCDDGQYAIVGGGIIGMNLIQALWKAGKVTVTGVCDTVGMGFWLGGGHGVLQGAHGLGIDHIVEARVVLGDGRVVTASETSEPDLFWALRGAGHNFGVVTEMKIRVHDVEPYEKWSHDTFLFSHDQVEEVFTTLNKMADKQGPTDHYFVICKNLPEFDPVHPVLITFIFSAGDETTTHLHEYSQPLKSLRNLGHQHGTVPYPDHSKLFDAHADSYTCKKGPTFMRFPLDVPSISPQSARKAFDLFSAGVATTPAFAHASQIIFEGYAVHAVQAVPAASTAFPWRADHILLSPFITYEPDASLDDTARELGRSITRVLHEDSSRAERHTYVNYANGEETLQEMYGYEPWRLEKLRDVKRRYDPDNLFRFNAGIR